jgi:hypothetical protein
LAEWLFEAGIGEDRAVLVEDGEILEAAIELPAALRAGAVVEGRLSAILIQGKRGIVLTAGGAEALIEPIPPGVTQGGRYAWRWCREAVPEAGRDKLAKVRGTDAARGAGKGLRDRIGPAREKRPGGADEIEAAGWSELLEQARTGELPFAGGALRMSLTPAMTLFDVDGWLEPAALAVAGAAAAGRAIRRLGSADRSASTCRRSGQGDGWRRPRRWTRRCRSRSSGPPSTASASCRSCGGASGLAARS